MFIIDLWIHKKEARLSGTLSKQIQRLPKGNAQSESATQT